MKVFSVLMVVGVFAVTGMARAEDFAVPINLPAGSVILLTVEKKLLEERGGKSATQVGTFRYRQEINPTPDGYTVRQTLTDLDMAGVPAPELQRMKTLTEASVNLTYEADENLAPTRIPGWQAYVDNIITRMTAAGALPGPAAAGVREMYENMSPEDGAAQLQEQNMVAAVQMAALDFGKPLTGSLDMNHPLGGPPIKTNYSVELTAVNKVAGSATVKTEESFDKDSIAAYMKVALPQIVAKLAPDAPKPTADDLAKLEIERRTTCVYEMDLKTGLASKADCMKTESGTDGVLGSKKIARFTMTQVLQARGPKS